MTHRAHGQSSNQENIHQDAADHTTTTAPKYHRYEYTNCTLTGMNTIYIKVLCNQ